MPCADAKIVAVYGRRGEGKTELVRRMVARAQRVVWFDPVVFKSGPPPGFCRVADVRALQAYLRRNYHNRWRVAYAPPDGAEPAALEDVARTLTQIQAHYAQGLHDRQVVLVIDEIAGPCPSAPGYPLPRFHSLIRLGRHDGVGVIGATQKPSTVASLFRSQAEYSVYFALEDATDFRAVGEKVGREKVEDVKRLAPYHFRCWHRGDWSEGVNTDPPVTFE